MVPRQWLLLRGLCREVRLFGDFFGIFREQLGADVVGLDAPGVGEAHAAPAPYRVGEMVMHLRQRWLGLGPGPWGVLGMSLGGMVAMDWAAAHAHDFSHVVIVNSSAANVAPPYQRMRLRQVSRLLRAVSAQNLERREAIVLQVTSNRSWPTSDPIVSTWATYARERPVSRRTFWAQLIAASRFRAPENLRPHTLIVGSARDALVAPMCSEKLAQRLNAPLLLHPSAGHDLPLDDGAWLAREVARWVST